MDRIEVELGEESYCSCQRYQRLGYCRLLGPDLDEAKELLQESILHNPQKWSRDIGR